jgi:hypothetical protein
MITHYTENGANMSRLREQRVWDTLKRHNDERGILRLWRVENLHCDGMADVFGINRHGKTFWIEAKALDEWPTRSSTHPLRHAFEPGQVPFLKEIRSFQGLSYCLLRVGVAEWFLLNPKCDIEIVDMTREEISSRALSVGIDNILRFLELKE